MYVSMLSGIAGNESVLSAWSSDCGQDMDVCVCVCVWGG